MKSLKTLLQEVTAGIKAWANANFSLGTHVHGNVTNNGKLATASKALVTDSNKNITTSSVTDTELGYLSGVTSSVQTQLNAKAEDSGVVHKTGNETIAGDKVFVNAQKNQSVIDCIQSTAFNVRTDPAEKTGRDVVRVWDGVYGSQGDYLGGASFHQNTDGSTQLQFICFGYPASGDAQQNRITFRAYRDGSTEFYPERNGNISFGKSGNKWKSVYSDSYYYGTTAWGLDKSNEWTGNNKFVSPNTNFGFKSTTAEAGSLTAASNWIYWQDKNNFQDAYISRDVWSDGSDSLRIAITSKRSNGAPSTTGTEVGCGFRLNIHANGNTSIDPFDNGGTDLGTSTNKWKTLNGVNPGALSLPNVNAVTGSSNTQLQDISGDLVQDQYFNCYFTPRMDGWAYIALNCSNATIRSGHSSYTVSVKTARSFANAIYTQSFTKNEDAWSYLQIFIPVTANKEITLECTFTGFSVTKGYVIPCLGNV